jgi:hypothetical protein
MLSSPCVQSFFSYLIGYHQLSQPHGNVVLHLHASSLERRKLSLSRESLVLILHPSQVGCILPSTLQWNYGPILALLLTSILLAFSPSRETLVLVLHSSLLDASNFHFPLEMWSYLTVSTPPFLNSAGLSPSSESLVSFAFPSLACHYLTTSHGSLVLI